MYITIEQIKSEVKENLLTQLPNKGSDSEIESLIGKAESRINAHLSSRYAVPVAPNTLCTAWTLSIFRYELSAHAVKISEWIKDDYKSTIRELERLADGKLHLPGITPSSTAPQEKRTNGGITMGSYEPIWA